MQEMSTMQRAETEVESSGPWGEVSAGGAEPRNSSPAGPPRDPPASSEGSLGRRRPGRSRRAVAGVAAAFVMMGGGYGIRAFTTSAAHAPAATASTSSSAATAVSAQQSGDVSALVQRAEKAVVKVTSQVTQQGPFGQSVTGQAVGTGFIVSSNGLILTNYHVVEAASSITVTLNDGRTYSATIAKADSSADLAVLKIDATGLSTLTLGNSSQALAGQSVIAIGYALDLKGSPTVTTGIVSATGRTIEVQDDNAPSGPVIRTYRDTLQISAAINSGNSGGPLLDLQGRVIGIDTAGASNGQNIGFAIPIDQAKALVASAQ